MPTKPSRAILAAVALAVSLSSCSLLGSAGDDSDQTTFEQLAIAELGELGGVAGVTLTQEARDSSASQEPMNADRWDIALSVEVTEAATVDEVAAVAEAVSSFSAGHAGSGLWTASIAMEIVDHDLADDMMAESPTRFEVYPTVRVSASADAREVMEFLALPGVETAVFVNSVPYIHLTSATDLAPSLAYLADRPMWEVGGSIWAEDGRVRIMQIPDCLTDSGYAAIIAASIAFPTAQFWLEAPRSGAGWPQLYIDRTTPGEPEAIAALLTDPAVAPAAINDYDVTFYIGDTAGLLGKR